MIILMIGRTLIWLIHLVLWDLNRIMWKRRWCALPDYSELWIWQKCSKRWVQLTGVAPLLLTPAKESCSEEHLWVYNLSLWVENECWLRVRHTRMLKTSQTLACAWARSPSTTGCVVRRSLPFPPPPPSIKSLCCHVQNGTHVIASTHTHPGVHCSRAVKLHRAVIPARRVLVCLPAD